MPIWPFKRSRADQDADVLLDIVSRVSRQPALFGEGRVQDTLEGRFEVIALHACLALIQLNTDPEAEPLAQNFTDKLFRHVDSGLREDGVGDLIVPKRMRKLAGSFYGRLEAYTGALALETDNDLTAALGRNVLGDETAAFAPAIAKYVRALTHVHAAAGLEALLADTGWPPYRG